MLLISKIQSSKHSSLGRFENRAKTKSETREQFEIDDEAGKKELQEEEKV